MAQGMYEVVVRHEGLGSFLESYIKATRPAGPIEAAAVERFEEWSDTHVGPAAIAALPAVAVFVAARSKLAGSDTGLRHVQIEQEQADLDRQNLLAGTLGGEKLDDHFTNA